MKITIVADNLRKEFDVRVEVASADMVKLTPRQARAVDKLSGATASQLDLLQALVVIAGGPIPQHVDDPMPPPQTTRIW